MDRVTVLPMSAFGGIADLTRQCPVLTPTGPSQNDYQNQLHLYVRIARTKAATAGECLRPGTVMRLMVLVTSGSTNGRRTLAGSVIENSGMKAKPIFAATIA